MKAKDLFLIILKVFGIYLIKDVLIAIPSVLYNIYMMSDGSLEMGFFTLIASLLTLGIYIGICYVLLFKAGWIVSKLKLTAGLGEEPLVMNLHRSSVYTIAIIISGIIILVFAVPDLVRSIYLWSQYNDLRKTSLGTDYFDYKLIIMPLTEIIIGLLFLGNQRTIVNFIESRRRQATAG